MSSCADSGSLAASGGVLVPAQHGSIFQIYSVGPSQVEIYSFGPHPITFRFAGVSCLNSRRIGEDASTWTGAHRGSQPSGSTYFF